MRLFFRKYRNLHKYGISVLSSEDNTTNLDDLIDLDSHKEELQDIISFINDRSEFELLKITPHIRYIFGGASGLGKTTLVKALAKKADVPLIIINAIKFCNVKMMQPIIDKLFSVANSLYPSIILIRELSDIAGMSPENQLIFSDLLYDKLNTFKDQIVIATASSMIKLNPCLYESGAFEKTLIFLPPNLEVREKLFAKFCNNLPLSDDISLNKLARDAINFTGGQILSIVQEATLYAKRKGQDEIRYSDFSEMLSQVYLGQKRKKTSNAMMALAACHEAGHVVAGYFCSSNEFETSDFKLARVEIIYRNETTGCTWTQLEENIIFFKKDLENKIVMLLGGMAAEQVIYSSTSSGVARDLSIATSEAISMVKYFGMNDNLGPISLNDNSFISPTLDSIADIEIKDLIKRLYLKAIEIIRLHRKELDALIIALLEKEILLGSEVEDLFKQIQEKY